jgi:hypothetical protein
MRFAHAFLIFTCLQPSGAQPAVIWITGGCSLCAASCTCWGGELLLSLSKYLHFKRFRAPAALAGQLLSLRLRAGAGRAKRCSLTSLLDNAAIEIAPPKKRWSLLPVLVVLFLISYGLMTLLIVEQGHTIQSQRTLIIDLFHDSATLTAIQGRIVHDNNVAQAEAKKSTQAPHTPSTQAAPKSGSKERAGKSAKPDMQLPAKPASDLLDRRRALSTI